MPSVSTLVAHESVVFAYYGPVGVVLAHSTELFPLAVLHTPVWMFVTAGMGSEVGCLDGCGVGVHPEHVQLCEDSLWYALLEVHFVC